MDTLQCAVLLGKLDRFSWEIEQRIAIGDRYKRLIRDSATDAQLLAVRPDRDCVWAQFTVFVPERAQVQAGLKAKGIPTAVHYPKPLHLQPAYVDLCYVDSCPRSIEAGQRVLSLPMSADLAEGDVYRTVTALKASVDAAQLQPQT